MAELRCLRCGALAEIEAPGLLTLGVKSRPIDATAPTCACGGRRWVRAGSTTEFYLYAQRADVCRVGDHIDPRARPYRLVPRGPGDSAHPRIVSLDANLCPDHIEHVRTHGLLGCFPAEDDQA